MASEDYFRVTFVRPDGWQYQTTGRASSEVEAVRLANDMLEYVERVGITDFLESDGLTARTPARLAIERVPAEQCGPGFGLLVTGPNGNVTHRQVTAPRLSAL